MLWFCFLVMICYDDDLRVFFMSCLKSNSNATAILCFVTSILVAWSSNTRSDWYVTVCNTEPIVCKFQVGSFMMYDSVWQRCNTGSVRFDVGLRLSGADVATWSPTLQ